MCSILVIDDERGILRVIHEALTRFGHQVVTAEDGIEGIQKFDDGSFDMVITDMGMPRMDGNAVAQYIRNSDKGATPIIGISGTPWLLKDSEINMILGKPFRLQELIESVSRLTAPAAQSAFHF